MLSRDLKVGDKLYHVFNGKMSILEISSIKHGTSFFGYSIIDIEYYPIIKVNRISENLFFFPDYDLNLRTGRITSNLEEALIELKHQIKNES